jgi:signal transduction histidine kinase
MPERQPAGRGLGLWLGLLHAGLLGLAVVVLRERLALVGAELAVALSGALTWRLLQGLREPLERLREGAQLLAESDFGSRLREVGRPEVDELVGLYNRMADHLREERTRQREQHHLLAQVLEVSPAGFLSLDHDGRIELANPAAARLLGVSTDALRGLSPAALGSTLGPTLAGLAPGQGEIAALPGGRRVRLRRGSFLDRGFPRTFLLLDELTEELRQAERAAYEKVIRLMAHEVGNSVGASRSLLESSLHWAGDLPPAQRGEFEQAVRVAIARLEQLHAFVRAFAEVVRLPPPQLAECAPGPLLEALGVLMQAQARALGVSWRSELEPGLPQVRADPVQLEQALVNIAKNALEAAGPHGRVQVRARREAGRVLVEVEDSGPGIPDRVARELFTPFFTSKPDGQGIGLTLVREILERHGCEFSLSGPPPGPTCFRLLLEPA